MRLSCFLFLVFIAMSGAVSGQERIVQGATPDLYLVHNVVAKETWYSLGRSYNLSPKDIAAYNKLSMDKSLEIGQTLRIPLTQANFIQSDRGAAGETLVPVYHVVGEKEWMYRISVNHNKVPIEQLEKWNNISRDQAKAGTKLIVGYLKVKDPNAASVAKVSTPAPAVQSEPVKQPEPVVKKESQKPAEQTRKPEATVTVAQPAAVTAASAEGGYFRSMYENTGKSATGLTGIFKSTSGWNDGKYYALMSNVVVGTIVKITYPQTNKSIYAKVLGELPDMKESAGLKLRLSDAAANELGAAGNKFNVEVRY